jgi:hypothetical protein
MRGLYRYLSPFTPDQSGAVSVLFELGGLIIICDAGGCAGNVCGFDEPRFYTKKSAVFSACLRDMDAIMGRDDRLIAKTGDALASFPEAKFIAYIGTPVPAVIGTDFHALRHMAENQFHLPVITCATNGMDSYDAGEEKAYRALIDTFASADASVKFPAAAGGESSGRKEAVPFAGVWGATPLELAAPDSARRMRAQLVKDCGRVVTYGMDSTLDDIRRCGAASVNYAVSPAGLAAAKYLEQKFGTAYEVVSPLSCVSVADTAQRPCRSMEGPVLVVHQQFMANAVRSMLRASFKSGQASDLLEIDAATFFNFIPAYAEKNDRPLAGEDDFIALVKDRGYRTIIADPLIRRALPDFDGTFIALPHFAVSGQLYAVPGEREFLAPLGGGLRT